MVFVLVPGMLYTARASQSSIRTSQLYGLYAQASDNTSYTYCATFQVSISELLGNPMPAKVSQWLLSLRVKKTPCIWNPPLGLVLQDELHCLGLVPGKDFRVHSLKKSTATMGPRHLPPLLYVRHRVSLHRFGEGSEEMGIIALAGHIKLILLRAERHKYSMAR